MSRFFSACSAVALLSACGAASAQMADYGALEELFGEPVTMSATGKPQRASEAPASMQIIPGDTIRRSGANNLAEVLQNYAGINVTQWSAGQYDVGVRGAISPSNPRLLVLVDGRQVYLDNFGLTNWSGLGIALAEIRQVEVVRGPNSALFGFNAATGVINILTYNALHDDINAVTMEAGNRGHLEVSGTFTLRMKDKMGLRLSGSYRKQEEYPLPESLGQPALLHPDDAAQRNFGAATTLNLGAKTELTLGYNYARTASLMVSPSWGRLPVSFAANGFRASLSSDGALGLFEATVYENKLLTEIDFRGDFTTSGAERNLIRTVKLQDLIRIRENDTIRLTAEYRYAKDTAIPDEGELSARIYSAGGMWEHVFSERLTATAAARIDKLDLGHSGISPVYSPDAFDRSFSEPSYNFSLVYKPDQVNSFRLSAARGVQAPPMQGLGFALPLAIVGESGNSYMIGDPKAKAPLSYSYEAAWTRQIPALKGAFAANLFYMQNKRVITYPGLDYAPVSENDPDIPDKTLIIGKITNRGSFDSYGLELTLNGKCNDRLDWEVNYTWNKIEEDFPLADVTIPELGGASLSAVGFENEAPRHMVNARLGYTSGPFEVNLHARFRSEVAPLGDLPLNLPMPRDSSLGVDARIAYHFGDHVEVYAVAKNLAHDGAVGLSTINIGRRFMAGTRITF